MTFIIDVWEGSKRTSGLFPEHFRTEEANQMPPCRLAVMNVLQSSQEYIHDDFLGGDLQFYYVDSQSNIFQNKCRRLFFQVFYKTCENGLCKTF